MSKKNESKIETEYVLMGDNTYVIRIEAAFPKFWKKHNTVTFEQTHLVVSSEYIKHLLEMKPQDELSNIGTIAKSNVRFSSHKQLARKISKEAKRHRKFNKLYV